MDYYITFHILAGYWLTNWFYSHVYKFAMKIGERYKPDCPKQVIAIFLLWPIVLPIFLIVMYWPTKNRS